MNVNSRRSSHRGLLKLLSNPLPDIDEKKDSEDLYFDSYARTSIHKTMIQDTVRTKAYKNAILHNKHLFKDKVVMDYSEPDM